MTHELLLGLLAAALAAPAAARATPQGTACSASGAVARPVSIPAIQGSGAKSPMAGAAVSTRGAVTLLRSQGFYLQDPVGDGDPATSDGIFVVTGAAPTVTVGQRVRVSGTVSEFNTGAANNATTLVHTVTELIRPCDIVVEGSGGPVPPVEVDLASLPAGGLEAYEGMVVTLRGPLMVQQTAFLGRFGQLTVAVGGRVYTPTHVLRPGAAAMALLAENQRRSILLDDASSAQNVHPTPFIGADNTVRAGDTAEAITGVVDFGLATADPTGPAMYKLHVLGELRLDRSHARTASPPARRGDVRIASANVLNFFTTFGDGRTASGLTDQGCLLGGMRTTSHCRGAGNAIEFNRQRLKTLAALKALDADVLALMEVQNDGDATLQYLVDQLNAELGAHTYAAVPAPAQGTGSDAIRVALIYRPGKLRLSGASISDPHALNTRPPLAQGFVTPGGSRFAVVVNHVKSKGSCPGAGDAEAAGNAADPLVGCWNARRVQQAGLLKRFLKPVQDAAGTNDVVLLGDLNAYAQEDPIQALTAGGHLIDAVNAFDPLDWSFIFGGASGRLDHALVTPGLLPRVAYAGFWHINADEPSVLDYNTEFKRPFAATGSPDYWAATPFRSSDHDPLVMDLDLRHAGPARRQRTLAN